MLRVLVWNEFYHEQTHERAKAIYPHGIHRAIADFLQCDDIQVKTATLEDENCGITKEVLAETDVLIWWGHVRHNLVPNEVVELVRDAVLEGMGMIFLHSAHHSKPFKALLGTSCHLTWRESGDSEVLWVIEPSHPITQGIDRYFTLEHEETYGEPFVIPTPDKLLFIGSFSGGEVFRAGCLFERGNGKIFYFQPGHETFPTFYQAPVQTVIRNAVRFVAPTYRARTGCPHVRKITDEGDYVLKNH
ncbi:MAG: trehalose utilization protein ThuA [Ruminococcaceae bacterium]|nr:trehalose utilization protein ThuA [Oscillospiraceae bacterium]